MALAALRNRGFEVQDTDEPGWTEWSDDDGGYVWREDRIAKLLARERAGRCTSRAPSRTKGGSIRSSTRLCS
jgi:hypothetical protein